MTVTKNCIWQSKGEVRYLTDKLLLFFCNSHLAPNNVFTLCHPAQNNFFSFSLLAPCYFLLSTFPPTAIVLFYFVKKVLVICKSAVYLFFR